MVKSDIECIVTFLIIVSASYLTLDNFFQQYFNFYTGITVIVLIGLLIGYIFENNIKTLALFIFILGIITWLGFIFLFLYAESRQYGSTETTASLFVIVLFLGIVFLSSMMYAAIFTSIIYITALIGQSIKKNRKNYYKSNYNNPF